MDVLGWIRYFMVGPISARAVPGNPTVGLSVAKTGARASSC